MRRNVNNTANYLKKRKKKEKKKKEHSFVDEIG